MSKLSPWLLLVVVGAACTETTKNSQAEAPYEDEDGHCYNSSVPCRRRPELEARQNTPQNPQECTMPPGSSRRFLAKNVGLYGTLDDERGPVSDPKLWIPDFIYKFPVNTEFEAKRILKDSNGQCSYVLLLPVNDKVVRFKSHVIAAQDWLSTSPVAGVPTEPTAQEMQTRAKAIADEEISSNHCSEKKVGYLREVLQHFAATLDSVSQSSGSNIYTLTSHKLVVTQQKGTELSFDPKFRGEYHVVAFGFYRGLALDAVDSDGYAIKTESSVGEGIGSLLAPEHNVSWATRLLQVNTSEQVKLKVKGYGCTLVVAFERN